MAYYGMGDYYGGRGDPFLGGILRGAVAIGRAALGIPRGPSLPTMPSRTGISITPPRIGPIALGPSISVSKTTGYQGSIDIPQGGGAPRGYHLAKDGSGRYVRNRRMNPANPAALRRSIRRIEGFGRLIQRSKKSVRKAAAAMGATSTRRSRA